ncbi:MAG: thioredoxin family protein [Rikenellaceae bacterium]
MRKLLITLSLFLTVISATAQVTFEESATLSSLLTKSKEEGKLIFVDCYASWCGPCKFMDNNVFSNKNVGEFMNDNFINAKFDMEKDEGPTIGRKYSIKSYPTFLILDSKGNIVAKLVGSSNANEFISRIETALKEKE